jgi:hypothetical protein
MHHLRLTPLSTTERHNSAASMTVEISSIRWSVSLACCTDATAEEGEEDDGGCDRDERYILVWLHWPV